uniref:Uncharacterized protein n=1 Tax=Amphora coffeiformis TaxID=265554 RepID=A0A7S3P4K7_9STRA|eukprot:scaffold7836_cov178-Amphora_coffeaeformis.AAC.3
MEEEPSSPSKGSVSFPAEDELSQSLNESQLHSSRRVRAPRPRFWSHGDEEEVHRSRNNNGQRGGVSTGEEADAISTTPSSPRSSLIRRRKTESLQVSGKRLAIVQHLKEQSRSQRFCMALIHQASQRLCKSARVYSHQKKHPRDMEMAFFQSSPALAIYGFITMAMISKRAIFLYGVLLVLWIQITWVALKWILYVFDDPELHTMHSFIKGWVNVLMREGSRITSGRCPRSLWFAGTIAREIPIGMGLARVYIRNFSQRVNQQTLHELNRHMVHYSRGEQVVVC